MKKTYKLKGLECANCAAKIEHAISKLPGVISVTVNFMTTKMVLEAEDAKMDGILAAAGDIVKKIEPGVVMAKA